MANDKHLSEVLSEFARTTANLMTVLAKGVGTAVQLDQSAALGCEACQGFYLVRPMPAHDIDRLLQPGAGDRVLRLPIAAAA